VGDAMAGSRTTRAGIKRTGGRRRAVGTRDRVVSHLAAVTVIADQAGMASTRLAEAVGYPGSSVAFAQLLSGMERDGLIEREVRGKRTYRITLADGVATAAAAAAAARANGAVRAAGIRQAAIPGVRAETSAAAFPAGLDYDELARRLLVQVVRRLAATPGDLEQTVASLERELATALTRHGTLTAENVRLREQLMQTQRELDLARELNRKAAVTTELSQAEVVLLDGLLTSRRENDEQESGATTGLTRRRSRAGVASWG
jgi:hypothetical protein